MNILEYASERFATIYNDKPEAKKNSMYVTRGLLRRDKSFKNTEDLKRSDDILRLVRNSNTADETKRKYLWYIAMLSDELGYDKQRDTYMEEYETLMGKRQKSKRKNVYEKLKDKKINDDLQNMRDGGIWEDYSSEGLIYNLLVFIDETPRLEYRTLLLNPTNHKDVNYLSTKYKTIKIVLNDYKTAGRYGQWTITVKDKKLADYIRKYIKYFELENGDYLFLNTAQKEYPSNKFSEMVKRAFKIKTGKPRTIRDIRLIKEKSIVRSKQRRGQSRRQMIKYAVKMLKRRPE